MKQIEQFIQQARSIIQSLGINPLILAMGLLFCLFFPRFFILAAFGYAVYWIAKNIWLDPKRKGSRKGRRRH